MAPQTSATITLDAAAAVEAIKSDNPWLVSIAGDNTLSLAADDDGVPTIELGESAGALRIYSPIDFSQSDLVIEGESHSSRLVLGGPVSANSLGLRMESAGELVLEGNNENWAGPLVVGNGNVRVTHSNALGAGLEATVLNEGQIEVAVEVANDFVVNGGTLSLAASAGDISLYGGSVYLSQNVPVSLAADANQTGEFQIPRDYDLPIVIPEAPAEGIGVRLVAERVESDYTREIRGEISSAGGPTTLFLQGRGARFDILSPLKESNNIHAVRTVRGVSTLRGNNDFKAEARVSEGSTLIARGDSPLGFADGTRETGTHVEPGGTLLLLTDVYPENERITIDHGTIGGGTIEGDVELSGDSFVAFGEYRGNLTGDANVTFRNQASYNSDIELHSANTYSGSTLIASQREEEIHVFHPHAFGDSPEAPVVVGGELYLHVVPDKPLHIDGGNVRLAVDTYDGEILARGGTIYSQERDVNIETPLQISGDGVSLASQGGSLNFNEGISGTGDIQVGGRVPGYPYSGHAVFNAPVTIDGDLVVKLGRTAFNVVPGMTGRLVLDQLETGFSSDTRTTFLVDASADVLILQGTLATSEEATFTTTTPALTMHGGSIDGNLAGVEQLVINTTTDARLENIGASDAEIVVERGTLTVNRQRGLGSLDQGVILATERGAALHIEPYDDSIEEEIYLNNAKGIDYGGALRISGGRENRPAMLRANIHLGEIGSTIGLDGHTIFQGSMTGGAVTFLGGEILLDAALKNTGHTFIKGDVVATENGSLQTTSRIEIRHGILELNPSTNQSEADIVGDNIPISLQGGKLKVRIENQPEVTQGEVFGAVISESGSSVFEISNNSSGQNSVSIHSLEQMSGSTVLFDGGLLGENYRDSPRIVIENAPQLAHGILGGWALVYREREYDFAAYDGNDRGIHALGYQNRPSELNGASAGDHVLVSEAPERLLSDTTIASLAVTNQETSPKSIDLGDSQLVVDTGGVLAALADFTLTGGSLTAGSQASHGDLAFHVITNDVFVESSITDGPAGDVNLVKSGLGKLHLMNANSYSGDTYVNDGLLIVGHEDALPRDSHIRITHGTIVDADSVAHVAKATVYGGFVQGLKADIYTLYGGSADIAEPSAEVHKIGPGTAAANPLSGFEGIIDIQEGTLRSSGVSEGTGTIIVREGAALRFGYGFRYSDPYALTLHLDGGDFSTYGGRLRTPLEMQRQVIISGDSEIEAPLEPNRIMVFKQGVQFDDDAVLTKRGPGQLRVEGELVVDNEATIHLLDGTLDIAARLVESDESSTLNLRGVDHGYDDGLDFILAGDNREFTGILDIEDLALRATHSNALGNGQTILGQGSRLTLEAHDVIGNVVLAGGDFITQNDTQFIGTLTNRGEMSPGSSPGLLRVQGSYTQESDGALVMEIASPQLVGSIYPRQYDVLEVSDSFVAGGNLEVRLLHDFSPREGDSFDFFDVANFQGEFDSILVPPLLRGLAWDLTELYQTGSVHVVAALQGDYNGNGQVEQSDLDLVLLLWGQEVTDPASMGWTLDLPQGVVDQQELDSVLLNWGTRSAELGMATVPEPAGWILALVVIAGMAFPAKSRARP